MPPGVALAFVSWFVLTGVRGSFAVLYPTIAAEPGWTDRELVAAFSVGALLYAPSTMAVGFLVDRIGIRTTMLGGCLLLATSLGMVATATADRSWQMLVGWAVAVGPAAACIGYIPIAKLLSLRVPAQLGRAMGLAMIGQGLSPLLIGPALQALTDLRGWAFAVVVFATSALLLLVPLVVITAPTRPPRSAAGTAPFSLRTEAHRPDFWLFLLGFLFLGYLLLIPTHLVAYLIAIGVAPFAAAVAAGLFGALNSLGATTGGWLADRWGPLRVLIGGTALLAIGTLALFDIFPSHLWMLTWYILIAGFGRGLIGITLAVAQAQAFAGPHFGRITGMMDVGFSIGAFAGPWLTIVGRDQLGSYVPGLASAVIACLLIVLLTTLAYSRARV